jgi:saccharopine dehydrogenase (NAD+, L-lysine-forming)
LAAFGFWAGYVGVALALLRPIDRALLMPKTTLDKLECMLASRIENGVDPKVLVIGVDGRCGRGALAALGAARITPLCWRREDTACIAKTKILDQDILVNCASISENGIPFLEPRDFTSGGLRRLTLLVDVACDVGLAVSPFPVYSRLTDWAKPVQPLDIVPDVSVIALNNLPTFLPFDSTVAFSRDLTPLLMDLPNGAPWNRALDRFRQAVRRSVVTDCGLIGKNSGNSHTTATSAVEAAISSPPFKAAEQRALIRAAVHSALAGIAPEIARDAVIDGDQNLVLSGYIDSVGILSLLLRLEEELGLSIIGSPDFNVDQAVSINGLTHLLARLARQCGRIAEPV